MKNTLILIGVTAFFAITSLVLLVTFTPKPQVEAVTLPIKIEVFSDFECPWCAHFSILDKQLVEKYGDKIDYEFRNFPLSSIHARSFDAAVATEAARIQGKFDEYHDVLFENQPPKTEFTDEDFFTFAEKVGLDVEKFKEDYKNNLDLPKKVQNDYDEGIKRNVQGTPTYFVNGEKYNSDPTRLEKYLDTLIERAQ